MIICVVGLGYVGLPLSLAFNKIDKVNKIEKINLIILNLDSQKKITSKFEKYLIETNKKVLIIL